MNINRIAALICHPSLFKRSKAESSVNEKIILTNQSDTSELDNILPTKQELNRRRRHYGVCLRCGTTLSDKA
ncbi:9485_t:CDS:2, partial [Acaulospora morrowiae]